MAALNYRRESSHRPDPTSTPGGAASATLSALRLVLRSTREDFEAVHVANVLAREALGQPIHHPEDP